MDENKELLELYDGQQRKEIEELLDHVGVIHYPPATPGEFLHSETGGFVGDYPYITEVTKDAVRHFVDGIGDDNPLWLEEGYAAKTKWGRVIAPPSFIWSCNCDGGFLLNSFTGLNIGQNYKFFAPIREGDRIQTSWTMVPPVPQRTRLASRAIRQPHKYFFHNQDDELICEYISLQYRYLKSDSPPERAVTDVPEYPKYTDEELRGIQQEYALEKRRGAEPRYIEDVQVGEELPPVIKGPWSVRDAIAYYFGIGSPAHVAHRNFWLKYQKERPYYVLTDFNSGLPEIMRMHHVSTAHARARGFPFAIEVGPNRTANQMHCLTNWMGDDGFITELSVRVIAPVMEGDVYRCSGRISEKFEDERGSQVRVELATVNQRAEETAPGWATIALPSRSRK
jgi:acyl dehydratase